MIIRAKSLGLKLPAQILAQFRKLSANNDYVRARYVVVREPTDISDQSVLRYCQTIRSSVIEALNMDEQGVPQGEHWLGAAKRRRRRHEQRSVDEKADQGCPRTEHLGQTLSSKPLSIAARDQT